MAIIPQIGRKGLKLRLAIFAIYAALVLGSITMIYPFLLMLSGSVKGDADIERMDPVPQLLYSRPMQFARFEEARYGDLTNLSSAYGRELMKETEATIPKADPKELAAYRQFIKENLRGFPDHFYVIQEMIALPRVCPRNLRLYKHHIRKECRGSIDEYNRRYSSALSSWNDLPSPIDQILTKEFSYGNDAFIEKYLKFKRSRPASDKAAMNLDGHYFVTQQSFSEVRNGRLQPQRILSATRPKGEEAVLWDEFVKRRLNCLFVKLEPEGMRIFRQFLSRKYSDDIQGLNEINDTKYTSFKDIEASYGEMRNSAFFTLYTDFITNYCPVQYLRVDTPSTRYREYVKSQTAQPPFVTYDYSVFGEMRKPFLKEILTRNYVNVIEYIAVYGRAIFNTVIFIGLSIIAALLVNPLAAYALSRFKLKSTYMILMFFMTTMAFPGAVTMIPNFLLLKHFHLLNSFWALILPGLANGYAIFILKGFFDSIPQEVYESAMIDGASEWTMFWRFTMALSTPILALITLGAFTSAYSAFMFALIICPDERMWTMMVWLYQMQQGAHQSVIYAALVLAAIPALLMFVLAQNVIMRGIVIPVEK